MSASESVSKSESASKRYRPETRLVHSGTLRSQFGETSEALFLTQGYVYDCSLTAERRFKPQPLVGEWNEDIADETRARYAFVFGDFRRLHRMGLIACYYRAAEWEHTEVMVAAHRLLLYLDKSRR